MAQFVLELAAARDPDDRGIAGIALYRRGRHRAAALELARRGPWYAGKGVIAGADDQLRPRPGAIALAARAALPAQFDQRVVLPLPIAARVIFRWLHEGLQRRPHGGAAFGIEQAVDPHHTVLWLAQVQVAPLMGAVGLGQRPLRIDPVLEVLGHAQKLT